MRRIALAVGMALSVVLPVAAADAKGPRVRSLTWELTQAQGEIRVTFKGDEAAGCRARGVCTLSGTTTYAFGGRPRFGSVYWARHRKRTIAFYGFFETRAETVSDVVSAGSDEHCIDRTDHEYEFLAFEPRSQRVRFNWRPQSDEEDGGLVLGEGEDVLDTRCAGPHLEDLEPSNALPRADVPYRVFRSHKGSFRTTGSLPFAGGGFAGTVDWNLRYALRYRQGRGSGFFGVPIG